MRLEWKKLNNWTWKAEREDLVYIIKKTRNTDGWVYKAIVDHPLVTGLIAENIGYSERLQASKITCERHWRHYEKDKET